MRGFGRALACILLASVVLAGARASGAEPGATGVRIPLRVVPATDPADGPPRDPFSAPSLPIPGGPLLSAGVPFARGERAGLEGLRVVTADGRPVPAQLERRGSWPDGSVRWLGVSLLSEPGVGGYRLESGVAPPIPDAVEVETRPDVLVVETGRLRAEVMRRGGSLRRVWLDGDLVLEQSEVQFAAFGPGGPEIGEAAFDSAPATVERAGPLHTVIRTEGRYAIPGRRARAPRWILRLHFHAGRPSIELQHTFVWDSGARLPVLRELGLRFGVPGGVSRASASRSLDEPGGVEQRLGRGESLAVLQDAHPRRGAGSAHAAVVHRRPDGQRPLFESARAAGHVSARLAGREAGGGHVTLALRDFWQRFPSELAVDGRSLVARLYTDAGRAGPLDLRPAGIADWIGEPLMAQLGSGRMRAQFAKARGARNLDPSGLARTHRLWLHFAGDGVSESDRVEAARAFELPPVLIADPAWSAGTGALGLVSAVDDARFPERESVVRTAYREVANLIDEWGDYGFLDHGAGPHHAYELDDEGRIRALPWRYSGVDFGFTRATWIAWLRSGERPYHDLASTRTHFNADVLRSHVDAPDRRLGDWRFWASGPTVVPWQSPGKGEPAEREGLAPALGLGGGFGLDVESLLFDYWLSGDLRSLEVAREVASALTRLVTDPEVPIERWAAEAHTNRSRWVFQTMVDLAVLGEQLDDATLSGAARRIAATALDPDAPGGVAHHPAPQGGPRLGHPSYLFYKAPWMLRYAATQTGDEAERTRQALVRGAEYALRTRSREGRTAGLRLGLGTRWSGDARYLAFGIERADVYRDLQNREPQGRRGYTRRLGGVLGNAADLLISQGAVMASLAERKGTLPAVPSLWKDAKRPAAAVLLAKRPGEPLSVELVHGAVRFERPDGSGWPASWLGAPTDYLPEWGTETVRHRRVVIPAGAAPGLYRIRAPWGAELVVLGIEGGETRLEAPEGFHLGGAGKAAWSFRFAPGPKRVFTSASGSVELLDPDGRPVTLRGKRGWTRVRGGDGVYRVRALAPAFFSASALGSRYAHAEASPAPLGGVPTPARLPEEDAPEVRVERGALSLLRKGTLELEADRVRTDAGSIEWWWQPDWDSGVLGKGERKGLVAVAGSLGESQLYYRYSTTSKGVDVFELRFEVNERVPAGSRKARRRQSPWLGRQQPIRWQRGQRLHVALEWWSEGERRHMRLLVDGVPMTGRAGRGESPVWPIPERPRFVRFGPGGSRRGLPFDGTLHAVRVSTAPRYRRAEIGAPPLPDGVDATTSLLCRFADREGACVDAAGRPAFRLSGG